MRPYNKARCRTKSPGFTIADFNDCLDRHSSLYGGGVIIGIRLYGRRGLGWRSGDVRHGNWHIHHYRQSGGGGGAVEKKLAQTVRSLRASASGDPCSVRYLWRRIYYVGGGAFFGRQPEKPKSGAARNRRRSAHADPTASPLATKEIAGFLPSVSFIYARLDFYNQTFG